MTIRIDFPDSEEMRLALDIAREIRSRGRVTYIVGGFVRDSLLGHKPKDLDMCATLSPQEMKELNIPGAHIIPTGEMYGTITFVRGAVEVEVTTTRYEIGAGDYRRDVTICFSYDNDRGPFLDVMRRDLTVNGMLCDPITGEVVDHVGGMEDLKKGLIRFIGSPVGRCQEDALRLLRAVRFAVTKGFAIDSGVFEASVDSLVKRRLTLLSGERVRDELLKILSVRKGADCAWAMTMLLELGVLETWFPELTALVDVRQNIHHSEDVWGHTLLALANTDGEGLEVRLAVLFHDLGKPVTKEYVGAHYGSNFLKHDKSSEELARKILRRLRFGRTRSGNHHCRIERLLHLVRHHMTAMRNGRKMSRILKRVGVQDFGEAMLEMSWAVARADLLGRVYPDMYSELEKIDAVRHRVANHIDRMGAIGLKDIPINGNDVMRLLDCSAHPEVGAALNDLLQAILDGEIAPHDKAAMEALVLTRRKNRE